MSLAPVLALVDFSPSLPLQARRTSLRTRPRLLYPAWLCAGAKLMWKHLWLHVDDELILMQFHMPAHIEEGLRDTRDWASWRSFLGFVEEHVQAYRKHVR